MFRTNISSPTVFKQVIPLGTPFSLWALTLLPGNKKIKFNVWYLDDETLRVSSGKILVMNTQLVDDLRGERLVLNSIKCEVTILSHIEEEEVQIFGPFKELLPKLELVPDGEFFLLGALSKTMVS